MALSEHYELRYLDPDEAISDFPSQWDHVIDKIDTAIHAAATDNVELSRIPNIPVGKVTERNIARRASRTSPPRRPPPENSLTRESPTASPERPTWTDANRSTQKSN